MDNNEEVKTNEPVVETPAAEAVPEFISEPVVEPVVAETVPEPVAEAVPETPVTIPETKLEVPEPIFKTEIPEPEQEEELGKIILKDAEGKEIECDVLKEFTSDETNKRYLIYTTNKEDGKGNVEVYSSIIADSAEGETLINLEDEADQQVIKNELDNIQKLVAEE